MGEFTNPLRKKTPPEHSNRVKDAQWLMAGNNKFKIKTYGGALDAIAGPGTLAAARVMKYKLGYPAEALDPIFGQEIYEYLIGKVKRSAAMVARANLRKPKRQPPTHSYPFSSRKQIIGFPYQGTHTRGNWQSDRGYDLATPIGTPILAIRDGVIGPLWGDLGAGGALAGKRIYVNSANGQSYYYAHAVRLLKTPGTRVRAGDVIANSGSANGVPHLHVTCRIGSPAVEILGGQVGLLKRAVFSAVSWPRDVPSDWEHDDCVPEEDLEEAEQLPVPPEEEISKEVPEGELSS